MGRRVWIIIGEGATVSYCGENRHGYNGEMRIGNQVRAPFRQHMSVGGFEKVSIVFSWPAITQGRVGIPSE